MLVTQPLRLIQDENSLFPRREAAAQKRLKAIAKKCFALDIAVDSIGCRDKLEKIERLNIGIRDPC